MERPYHPAIKTDKQGQALRWITGDFWIDHQHWLHGPTVVKTPVEPEASTQAIIVPWSAILHTNAGVNKTSFMSLITYWRRADIVGEAHFQVDGVDITDPSVRFAPIAQAIPLNRKADCNYKANRWWNGKQYVGAISFETQDRGGATLPTTPWSLAQVNSMVSTLTWLCVCYGVWCTAPANYQDSGIGYHSQYPEWSSYVGKTCPGAARIRQMDYVRQGVAGCLSQFSQATGWQCGKGFPV